MASADLEQGELIGEVYRQMDQVTPWVGWRGYYGKIGRSVAALTEINEGQYKRSWTERWWTGPRSIALFQDIVEITDGLKISTLVPRNERFTIDLVMGVRNRTAPALLEHHGIDHLLSMSLPVVEAIREAQVEEAVRQAPSSDQLH